jgi:hypothetical protein
VVAKLRAISEITDPLNVIIGETMSILDLPDTAFPRCELLMDKLKFSGFIDQRMLEQNYRLCVSAYMKRPSSDHAEDVTEQDMYDAITFGRKIMKAFMSANDDKLAGRPVCEGFLQMNGYPTMDIEYEMFAPITGILISAEPEIQLIDTYTN